MGKRGPKIIQFDWDEFDKLCHIQCTEAEIASFFCCSVDTLARRVEQEKNCKFAEYYEEKKKGGYISIRRRMFQLIEKANPTMLVWLSKQYLGFKDKQEFSGNITNKYENMTKEELKKKLEEIKKETE